MSPPPSKKIRSFKDPLQFIKGVGPKKAILLEKLGLRDVEDALYFLPHRYEDQSSVKTIAHLVSGEPVTVMGEIINAGSFHINRRKKIFEIIIEDDTGTMRAKWFKFNEKFMTEKYIVGDQVILSGKPVLSRYSGSGLEFIHPNVEYGSLDDDGLVESGRIVPVYSTTEGLHLKSIRSIMRNLVEAYAPLLDEFLPEDVIKRFELPSREEALRAVHFPPAGASIEPLIKFKSPAQIRLIVEELFLIQLAMAFKRKHNKESERGTSLATRGPTIKKFVGLLKFNLTSAQKKVLGEIMDDLEKDRPMNRLLHGDVGSGKTIIALISLLTAIDNGMQGALMAPTELLAEQHFNNIQQFCKPLGIKIELVTGTIVSKEKKLIYENVREGHVQIVIGTHALIQKDIQFQNLGLAVIDEQHRFGVRQREALGKKGIFPHTLVMTATPIPRSLALTVYGDMDVSVLNELPPGRQPIKTKRYFDERREDAYLFLAEEIKKGRQAYVVCPLIEESETRDLKTVTDIHLSLQGQFPNLNIGLIHGRLKMEERQKIMAAFLAKEINVLVATTVIEVGIDVPNATVMVIEHAERFGLSQLHQLRGRIGRGEYLSYCLLIAYYPVSDEGKERLDAMLKSIDGFYIAEEDLRIRGPGDFLGTRQSGLPTLRVANLIRDLEFIAPVREEAFRVIDLDPNLQKPANEKLKKVFQEYIGDRIDLMDIL
ncbi:MAG: ATP-dependent DNA helicase RecG [Nitrospinales bacterium]